MILDYEKNSKCKGVYRIRNLITEKCYIGSTSLTIKKRITGHLSDLKNNKHHSLYLQRAWNKYGEKNFVFEILEVCKDKTSCREREQLYLDTCKSLYNVCLKATNGREGLFHSEETKNKIRNKKIGVKATAETKDKMSNSHKKLWTEERKLQNTKLFKGRKNTWLAGKQTKELVLKRMNSIKKPITQYDLKMNFIKEWESAKDAEVIGGYNADYISLVCRGKQKHHKKFIWKYKIKD